MDIVKYYTQFKGNPNNSLKKKKLFSDKGYRFSMDLGLNIILFIPYQLIFKQHLYKYD